MNVKEMGATIVKQMGQLEDISVDMAFDSGIVVVDGLDRCGFSTSDAVGVLMDVLVSIGYLTKWERVTDNVAIGIVTI